MRISANHAAQVISTACALALLCVLGLARTAAAQASDADPLPTLPPAQGVQGVQIVQIDAPTQAQVNALAGMVDVWAVDHAQGVVIAAVDDAAVARLRSLGYSVVFDAVRTAAANAAATLPAQSARAASVAGGGIPGYACYRTVAQTYADMAALADAHPTLAQWVDFGDSWDKLQPDGPVGFDLRALAITNRARTGPKFPFVIIASIHARELAPAEVAARFAERLVNGYGEDPTITWLLDYGAIYIVPMANPDGRTFAQQLIYWRKNTHDEGACLGPPSLFTSYGVDLNRNGSFGWGTCTAAGCSSTDKCSMVYRGAGPASEPETQALQTWLATRFADQRGPALTDAAPRDTEGLFVSLHSYGQLVLYPWGFTGSPSPNAADLLALGSEFGARTGYTTCQAGAPGCLYATDGTNDDWAYGTLGVAAYTIEMGTEFFEGCGGFDGVIDPSISNALLYGATAARRPYEWPQGPATIAATLTPTRVVPGEALTLAISVVADDVPRAPQVGGIGDNLIAEAAAWLDAPPWGETPGTPMIPVDGAFDSSQEAAFVTFDTTTWSIGRHTIFWRAASTAAEGVPGALFIDVTDAPTDDPAAPEPPSNATRIYLPFLVQ